LIFNDLVKGEFPAPFDLKSIEFRRFTNRVARACFTCLETNRESAVTVAVGWALGRIGEHGLWDDLPTKSDVENLLGWIVEYEDATPGGQSCFALSMLPLLARDSLERVKAEDMEGLIRRLWALPAEDHGDDSCRFAALIIAWYRGAPWTDAELAQCLGAFARTDFHEQAACFLRTLGDAAVPVLEGWDSKRKPSLQRPAAERRDGYDRASGR
jgi:hypothetical protein